MFPVLMKILHRNQLPVDCRYWVVTVNYVWSKGWTVFRVCQVQDTVENIVMVAGLSRRGDEHGRIPIKCSSVTSVQPGTCFSRYSGFLILRAKRYVTQKCHVVSRRNAVTAQKTVLSVRVQLVSAPFRLPIMLLVYLNGFANSQGGANSVICVWDVVIYFLWDCLALRGFCSPYIKK
jgi:hypothetical protein